MKSIPVFATLLILVGCNFESPLTEKPTRRIDPALLGSWFCLEDGSKLEIYRLSGVEYLAIANGTPYVCTHSDLDGTSFISCQALASDASYGKYGYISYKLKNGELTLVHLSDTIKLKDDLHSAEIRKIIESAIKSGKALDADPLHEEHYKRKP